MNKSSPGDRAPPCMIPNSDALLHESVRHAIGSVSRYKRLKKLGAIRRNVCTYSTRLSGIVEKLYTAVVVHSSCRDHAVALLTKIAQLIHLQQHPRSNCLPLEVEFKSKRFQNE